MSSVRDFKSRHPIFFERGKQKLHGDKTYRAEGNLLVIEKTDGSFVTWQEITLDDGSPSLHFLCRVNFIAAVRRAENGRVKVRYPELGAEETYTTCPHCKMWTNVDYIHDGRCYLCRS